MWLPATADELEAAVAGGDLEEGPALDGKRELDRDGWKLAVDVAAMTTDGGVIVVGLGEDEHGRLTVLNPQPLVNLEERVAAIVSSSLAEAPFIELRPLARGDGTGYLLIHVPMSARAPHQVIAKGKAEGRYYGRYGTTNRVLSEAEIARLYERRLRWQTNGRDELAKIRASPPRVIEAGRGYLQAFAYPVMPDLSMWDRARAAAGNRDQLRALLAAAARDAAPSVYKPHFADTFTWRHDGGDVWALDTDPDRERVEGYSGVRVEVDVSGQGQLLMARAAESNHRVAGGLPILWEAVIVGNLAGFLAMMGRYFELAGYFGPVSIGVAVHGIEGAVTSMAPRGFLGDGRPYGKPDFERVHTAGAAAELREARPLALSLVQNLVDASTGVEGFDPLG